MEVIVTWTEITVAALAGALRQAGNERRGNHDAHGFKDEKGEGWGLHIEGAIAEYAVSKGMNVSWVPAYGDHRLSEADVGEWQVRSTRHPKGRMIIHHSDDDDCLFYLAIASRHPRGRSYRIVGAMKAREAKRAEWWEDPVGGRPAFFVPQAALDPKALLL